MAAAGTIASEVIKASPVFAIAGASILGIGIQDWFYGAAFFYTLLQAYILVRDKIFRRSL